MNPLHLYLIAGIIAAIGLAINAAQTDPDKHCQSQLTLTYDACYLELTK